MFMKPFGFYIIYVIVFHLNISKKKEKHVSGIFNILNWLNKNNNKNFKRSQGQRCVSVVRTILVSCGSCLRERKRCKLEWMYKEVHPLSNSNYCESNKEIACMHQAMWKQTSKWWVHQTMTLELFFLVCVIYILLTLQ